MTVNTKNRALRLTIGTGLGSAVALIATYCAFRLHWNFQTAGFIDLLIVTLTALKFGFWEATGRSFVAVGCLDYFFAPPIYSLHVADPENVVALVTFEIIALVVSRLSNQLRSETQQSRLHRMNAEKLYELSRSIVLLERQRPAGAQMAFMIKKHVEIDSVAIFDGGRAELYRAGSLTKEVEDSAKDTYFLNANCDLRVSNEWRRVLRLESEQTFSGLRTNRRRKLLLSNAELR